MAASLDGRSQLNGGAPLPPFLGQAPSSSLRATVVPDGSREQEAAARESIPGVEFVAAGAQPGDLPALKGRRFVKKASELLE